MRRWRPTTLDGGRAILRAPNRRSCRPTVPSACLVLSFAELHCSRLSRSNKPVKGKDRLFRGQLGPWIFSCFFRSAEQCRGRRGRRAQRRRRGRRIREGAFGPVCLWARGPDPAARGPSPSFVDTKAPSRLWDGLPRRKDAGGGVGEKQTHKGVKKWSGRGLLVPAFPRRLAGRRHEDERPESLKRALPPPQGPLPSLPRFSPLLPFGRRTGFTCRGHREPGWLRWLVCKNVFSFFVYKTLTRILSPPLDVNNESGT